MPASSLQLQAALKKPYDLILFAKEVLSPVFNTGFSLSSSLVKSPIAPSLSESAVIDKVSIYGKIELEDGTDITCYELILQPNVRIEYSKVSIQHYVRKLLTAGQAALINFVSPSNKNLWRLTLVAKDSILTAQGIKERTTHSKRYTYLLGPNESCKTAAERFEFLSTLSSIDFESLVTAFSVEKLSKAFFDEYTQHYENFVNYLTSSIYKRTIFIGDEKEIRDFTKKLLGRIVFLYFVQKKGWLGASDTEYKDGNKNFIMDLFTKSEAGENFYPQWLTKLFFDTLNNSTRKDDIFEMPDNSKIKIPFLNGGLFDKEEYDAKLLRFKSKLFHNHNNDEDPKERGFLDFLNAFNFTIYEDSPDEKTVAVDPEMLGHIFENLLEDNKDKGAFYTPKEIVHYMCQESLIEYLSTHLSKEYTVYRPIDSNQVEFIGYETRVGQLGLVEEIGDKALNRNDVSNMVKSKDIENLTGEQIKLIDNLLDKVKICDPAIGSGAFPMGLLLEIFSLKELIAYKLSIEWKPSEVKENIIQNSIYGVDIEKGAVDIARLRFWLSLVVDVDKPKPLPNLDYKIVVGDSLVSKFDGEIVEIEWNRTKVGPSGEKYVHNIQSLLKEVTEKQRLYFDSSNKDKKKLSAEIRRIKIDLLINQVSLNKLIYNYYNSEVSGLGLELSAKEKAKNSEIQITIAVYDNLLKKLSKLKSDANSVFNHFDWKLDFPEILNPYLVNGKGGFDIVIANPPYIDSETMVNTGNEELRKYLSNKLSFCKGNWDIYIAFFDVGYHLLNEAGNLVYISPDKWISKPFGYLLRKELLFNYISIAEAGRKVFLNAKVDSIITFLSAYKSNNLQINKFMKNKVHPINKVGKNILVEPYTFDWLFSDFFNLITEIDELPGKLSKLGICENACATSDAYKLKNYLFQIESKKFNPDEHMKVVNTGTISKFVPLWGLSQMTYLKDKYLTPVVDKKKFLKGFNNSYSKKATKPKVIIKGLTLLDACLDISGSIIPGKSTLIITKETNNFKELYSILAFINSRLPLFYIKEKYRGSSYNQGINFTTDMINDLPIPKFNPDQITSLEYFSYCLFILGSHNVSDPSSQILNSYFLQIIDGIIYEAYFPKLLKKHNREFIKHLDELPEIKDEMSDETKLEIIKKVFNRLNAKDHPVRINLYYLDSIPEIRIIQGKSQI